MMLSRGVSKLVRIMTIGRNEISYLTGISKLMITGTCEKISKEAAKMAEKHAGYLYFTAGRMIHPCMMLSLFSNQEFILTMRKIG